MKAAVMFQKKNIKHWLETLRYFLYVIFHPFDGFWDLIHEKRGSLAAANTILVLVLLVQILKLQFTNFLVPGYDIRWEYINIIKYLLGTILPIIIGCVGNWCLTTLFDGKGKLKDIYMALMYAMTPFVLIQIPLLFVSNIITLEELAFYTFFSILSTVWSAALLLAAIMMVHDYSFMKAILCVIFTAVAMLIIVFIILLFFSLISDTVAYFVSLYKEIIFRLY